MSLMVATSFFSAIKAQEIGLQLYSLREQMKLDVENYHKIIQQWGIQYIEGGDTYGMSDRRYKALLDKYNLQMVSIGGDYEEMMNDPEAVIERAKDFGAKYIVTFWIPHKADFGEQEAKEAVVLFNKVGKMAKAAGLTFCYHPHGYEFKPNGSGTLFDFMLANSTDFKFEMDVFWVKMGGGDPLKILKEHPDKFPLLHLKDRKTGTLGTNDGTGDDESNVVLGKGDIAIKEIIEQAKKGSVEYMIIEDESSKSVAQIPQSVYYINQVLQQ
jgi:sugar phosphate isomerase/epimerase